MTRPRILPRALASLGAVVLVASVPAWSLANASGGASGDAPEQATEPWLDPEGDSPTLSADDATEDETPDVETDASSATSSGGSQSPGGAAFDGTSGWVDFNGGKFWIGPPGSHSEVTATVAAYRANRGLPAFVPIENLGGWSCSMVAHGSAVVAGEPTTETLGQLLIRRSPDAVGFRPTTGWAVSATVVVDELILGGGGVYPNRATQIGVMHCAPPPNPSPPPVEPSVPPVEPSPPPAPAEPGPTGTPAP